MSKNNSIVIFAVRGPAHYWLSQNLAKYFNVTHIVYQRSSFKRFWKWLRYRLKKLGIWTVFGQLLFILYDKLVLSKDKSEARVFGQDSRLWSKPEIPSIEVDDINDSVVEAVLRREKPAVVVVSGTGLIREPILKLAPRFINIHTGITPEYRGVHGAFWALFKGDLERLGVTIHVIDAGVDTGRVLAQDKVSWDREADTLHSIFLKQYLRGTALLIDVLRVVLAGTAPTVTRVPQFSKQWFHPTIWQYLRWRFTR